MTVDLPRVRRYRNGAMDRLYVEDAEGLTFGRAAFCPGFALLLQRTTWEVTP